MESAPSRNGEAAPEGQAVITLGNLSLNLWNYRASVDGAAIGLTYQELELLRLLARNADRVVPFEVLERDLWQSAGRRETRRLNVLAFRLRAKLSASYPYRLETVRGRGYGLLSETPVRPQANAS